MALLCRRVCPCIRSGGADLSGFLLHVRPLCFARHVIRAFAQSIVRGGESAHVFSLQLRQLAEQCGDARRMCVRVGGPVRRLRLIRLSPVRLLPMARLAIGRRAARWFRVRRRISIGVAAAAADAATRIALLGWLAAIRLAALFAIRAVATAAAYIRSTAISTSALPLFERHAAAVRQSETASSSVGQASSL